MTPMNNPMQQFEELAGQARTESAPAPDVAAKVMRTVRLEAANGVRAGNLLVLAEDGLPLWSVAAALLVVGLATALVGYGSWTEWNGSVYAWMPDFSSWRYL